jgi:imidazolonepropionase-like amidohydrolase
MKRFTVILAFLLLQTAGSFGRNQVVTVISGATLIDGTGRPPVAGVVVIIGNDRIAELRPLGSFAIPQGARVIDGTGKFILPGLIDTHVHLEMIGLADIGELPAEWSTKDQLRKLIAISARLDLISGFTTVRDLGSTEAVLKIRDRINSGELCGPRILAAGMQLVKKSGEAHLDEMFTEYDGPESAGAKVRLLSGMGVDVIKIRLTHMRPVPSLDEVRAIVDEAHRLGLRATVHTDVPADDLVALAIDAGADGIEHNAPLRSHDAQTLTRMAQKHMSLMAGAGAFYLQRIDSAGLIDTFDQAQSRLFPAAVLAALRAGLGSLHEQTRQMKQAGWDAAQRQASFSQELRRARRAGVLVVFGTDCGAYGIIPGEQYKALYGETRMGASAMEAILMATRDAAIALGRANELGTIEPGKLADMIIVNADPLADLRNLSRIYRVIKGGSVYDPAELISAAK